ncbi:membrane protein [soil metagenome]
MSNTASSRAVGVGRLLIAVYAILALAATARSGYQIATKFETAPTAYLLSALAGVVYILATVALLRRGSTWYRVAWITIVFELAGVLAVGTLSLVDGVLFPADTVWSFYGRGYLFIPLVLPILGMLWLYRRRPSAVA